MRSMIITATLVMVAVGTGSCDSGGTNVPKAQPGDYGPLRRPLHLPRLGPDDRCPSPEPHRIVAGVAPGLGTGPVYPVGFGARGMLHFEYPPPRNSEFAGSGWGGEKILWTVSPRYRGPVLIRARQLDGQNEVRLGVDSGTVNRELRFPGNTTSATHAGSPKGWRYFPSYTRLRASGCYAYQVDGTTFSRVIIFRAEAWLPIANRLGEPGCRPPSPLAAFGHDLPESAGRLSRVSVWALFSPPYGTRVAVRNRAVFSKLAGKNMRIAFHVTGSGPARFTAVAPDGLTNAPITGPTPHRASTWERPGDEWGVVFHFGRSGCWRLHVSRRGGTGDVWLIAR